MKKNLEIEFKVDPEELAYELRNMTEKEQAEFLYEIAGIYRRNPSKFLIQLQDISDEIEGSADLYNKASIIATLEKILEYLKDEGSSKTEKPTWVFSINTATPDCPHGMYKCSLCGGRSAEKLKVCPNCKSKMDIKSLGICSGM